MQAASYETKRETYVIVGRVWEEHGSSCYWFDGTVPQL